MKQPDGLKIQDSYLARPTRLELAASGVTGTDPHRANTGQIP
jgi:hypothetical protein